MLSREYVKMCSFNPWARSIHACGWAAAKWPHFAWSGRTHGLKKEESFHVLASRKRDGAAIWVLWWECTIPMQRSQNSKSHLFHTACLAPDRPRQVFLSTLIHYQVFFVLLIQDVHFRVFLSKACLYTFFFLFRAQSECWRKYHVHLGGKNSGILGRCTQRR